MAAVYAALLSISRSLDEILDLERRINPLHREKMVSLNEQVDFIVTFLEDYSDKCHGKLDCIGSGITKAAYQAQDFIDSYLCSVSRSDYQSSSSMANCDASDLNMALDRIHFMREDIMKTIKNSDVEADIRSRTFSSSTGHSSVAKVTAGSMVVGLDDDLNAIKERLYEYSARLQIVPIVGMGGIGKTALATRAYEDSRLARYFDVHIWITVSMEYQRREILSNLLQYFEEQSDVSEAELAKQVYQNLIGRRYLIVIDDIWNTKAWDDLKMVFPDDENGSRILLTTRISDVAVYAGSSWSPPHQMKFLDEDQSWTLLQERVFGAESCPLELVEIGKKIARNCGGLPLTIVVVAGLLISSKNMMKEELWANVSENISSTEPTIASQCSKILWLSYDWLPLRLKPCFLYISAFPEDSEIFVSKLIKLWDAEGFLKPKKDQSECLEDVGECCLEDLVSRSLILVRERRHDGKLVSIGIHDLLRDISATKAQEEGFFHHVSPEENAERDTERNPNRRRLISRLREPHHYLRVSDSNIRSVVITYAETNSRLSVSCRHLTILDAARVPWPNLCDELPKLVNLRYIAFRFDEKSCPRGFPAPISRLVNLQTIVVSFYDFLIRSEISCVPHEIWKMPKLRHLFMVVPLIMDVPLGLSDRYNIEIFHESHLQNLGLVLDFKFTDEAIKMLANLKMLKVYYGRNHDNMDDFNLSNISHLQKLEELEVSTDGWPVPFKWKYKFPISLKRLTIKGVPLPWENMAIIGSLPNLQALQILNADTDESSEWTPVEGQFPRLRYFRSRLANLVKWEVEKEHLPSLETLALVRPLWIDEIPRAIGDIDSLQHIVLEYCRESLVNSATRIQQQQHENGNYAFRVSVLGEMPSRGGIRPRQNQQR